jgi:3-hydroxyisobutyrate dehydrogenase-like beta-hydroxyacid dehydrogenase
MAHEVLPVQSVGFVGLGDMGGPIARRIAAAGFPLAVWSRRNTFDVLGAHSFVATASLRELGAGRDVVGVCVFDDADVREVALGSTGLLSAMGPDSILIIHSTISVDSCVEIAAAGAEVDVHVLDAPVSGASTGAIRGALAIMVGGDPALCPRVMPLLRAYGNVIRWMGPVGSGQRMKMLNNVLAFANGRLANIAIETAAELGLDVTSVIDVLASGSAGSSALDSLVHVLIPDPAYTAHAAMMIAKDTALFSATCRQCGLTPTELERLATERIAAVVPVVGVPTRYNSQAT